MLTKRLFGLKSDCQIPAWLKIGAVIGGFLRLFNRSRKGLLIIKPGSLGDALLFTGALRELRKQYPDDQITLATSDRALPIFERCPHIDVVLVMGEDFSNSSLIKRLKRTAFAYRVLRRRYRQVACHSFKSHSWYFGIFILARAETKFYLYDRELPQAYVLPDTFTAVETPRNMHELDKTATFFNSIGCQHVKSRENIWPDAFLTAEEMHLAESHLAGLKGNDNANVVLTLCPGARFKYKSWGEYKYVELLEKLSSELLKLCGKRLIVAILGGREDRHIAEKILSLLDARMGNQKQAPNTNRLAVHDLTGVASLHQSVALIAASDFCIGNDTFGLHAAIAVDTPSIVIMWGGSGDQWIPWRNQDKHRMVRLDVDCSGCAGRCTMERYVCVESISVDMVLRTWRGLL